MEQDISYFTALAEIENSVPDNATVSDDLSFAVVLALLSAAGASEDDIAPLFETKYDAFQVGWIGERLSELQPPDELFWTHHDLEISFLDVSNASVIYATALINGRFSLELNLAWNSANEAKAAYRSAWDEYFGQHHDELPLLPGFILDDFSDF